MTSRERQDEPLVDVPALWAGLKKRSQEKKANQKAEEIAKLQQEISDLQLEKQRRDLLKQKEALKAELNEDEESGDED